MRLAPANAVARVGLGRSLHEDAPGEAESHYRAALAVDGDFAPAHQGLARLLADAGDAAAREHLRRVFAGRAVERRRFRGKGAGVPLLVAARGGNIPTRHWIDDRAYAVTAVCADFYDDTVPLPECALAVNAIGDADLCGAALGAAERIVAGLGVPVVNRPERVQATGREANASRLGDIPGVVVPRMLRLRREGIGRAAALGFPLLLRAPRFHTGRHFLRVDSDAGLEAAAADLPAGEVLALSWLDARGADGMSRKYRAMLIGGEVLPLHLAIGAGWKVHYFSAAMARRVEFREEERRFLQDMAGVVGVRAMAALREIGLRLGLDYAGVDFALGKDGSLLLFEANATMVINPPGAEAMWDYRRGRQGAGGGAKGGGGAGQGSGVGNRARRFAFTAASTLCQSPARDCRNSRAVGYQGLSARPRSQRKSAPFCRSTQTGRASAPARWASDVSTVTMRSISAAAAAASAKSASHAEWFRTAGSASASVSRMRVCSR